MFDQPPADNWTNRGRDCGEPRPRANGTPAIFVAKGGAYDGKTSGDKQSRSDALESPRQN